MRPQRLLSIIAVLAVLLQRSAIAAEMEPFTNTIGMKMIPIQAGEFQMGELNPTPPENLGQFELLPDGDWDERPVRKVTITNGFHLSETEVTIEQFRRFRPDYTGTDRCAPYVCNISWKEAMAFCDWLSKREGKPYRLPTEAEWEYTCRAGTTTLFSSGDLPPEPDAPNPWGLKNMHRLPAEWCLDWHGMYPDFDETDPVGPESGVARVIRGGGIQAPDSPYYLRSANRAGLPPEYPFSGDESARMGDGVIPVGFRVAMAPLPRPSTWLEIPFPVQCVKQSTHYAKQGPDPEKPYFTMRPLLPIPPDNDQADDRLAAGIHPAVLGHNHSPGMTVCSNGDVLACFFTSSTNETEYKPNVCFMMTRLRFGSDQWDMPELFYDFPDAAEQSALLWNDRGILYLFTGGVDLPGVPFRWCKSEDNGATWFQVNQPGLQELPGPPEKHRVYGVDLHLPLIRGPVGSYSPQPINSAFRLDGTIFVASDGKGGTSLLWASDDDGKTWYDTGGRTGGRHTTFVPLSDGRILGLGGKNTDIDGYMPQSISSDHGKTWEVSRTIFAALAFNQRPTLIRLQSGRLFFASDFQSTTNKQPKGITERGSFVALSDDEGKTWHIKKLDAAQPHECHTIPNIGPHWGTNGMKDPTLGYSVAAQAPNGIIHLMTTMNHPCLHFEMNEAWILCDAPANPGQFKISAEWRKREDLDTFYPNGKLRGSYEGKVTKDGHYRLDGPERWLYDNGQVQYEVTYQDGKKVGSETYWTPDGKMKWRWDHNTDGTSIWSQYWTNGNRKSQSTWRNFRCVDDAFLWDRAGKLIRRTRFVDGYAVESAEAEKGR